VSSGPAPGDPQTQQVTLINVFELPADQVDAFAAAWLERLDILAAKDGFLSARLYRAVSADTRFQLINVARWASAAAFEAAVADGGFRRGARASAVSSFARANPALYRVLVERTSR